MEFPQLAFPGAETLLWMLGAAAAGYALAMSRDIGRRYHEWRRARRLAQGEDPGLDDWHEPRGYQPGMQSEEEYRAQPRRAIGVALYGAVCAWIWCDIDPAMGELLLAGLVVLGAVWSLIANLRRSDEELGVESSDPMQGPPSFWRRHRRVLQSLLGSLAMLALAALLVTDSADFPGRGWALGGVIVALLVLAGFEHSARIDAGEAEAIQLEQTQMIGLLLALFIVLVLGLGALVLFV